MQDYSVHPIEMVASFSRNFTLIRASVKREVFGRYRGSFLGILWSFFNPLFTLGVYTFVFSEVLKARWSVGSSSKVEFALVLFAGLMSFNLFAECINRAPALITNNPNYVKKVVFPLEILPWVVLGSALFHFCVSLCVWLLAYVVFYGVPHATVLYFPLVLLPFSIFILGASWILASLGVFLRDVSQFIGIVITALMFLSPIFYPASALPEGYRPLLYLNPLTPVIELSRDVLYWGKQPDFKLLGIYLLAASLVTWLGFVWFQKTRKGFADVL
ncbi:ABC transporter permease [Rhizobium sp. 3T7]|uniref:ABC transporter permease n=1 Tax=Rhizobium sp. 3T7 TaxID=2874922 RepID=UPI001CD0110A|nr:ABC transporter permease [Rhizobium sp. 3T7]MBZ9792896.1 ABC transporter permease [Rhizobium sp. 3T7]